MKVQTQEIGTQTCERVKDEELADVLTAISVVSKRLAKKLMQVPEQDKSSRREGEKKVEQNE